MLLKVLLFSILVTAAVVYNTYSVRRMRNTTEAPVITSSTTLLPSTRPLTSTTKGKTTKTTVITTSSTTPSPSTTLSTSTTQGRSTTTKKCKSDEKCTKFQCILSAREILSNMNRSVDPCDNFYQFACGNFRNATKEFYSSKAYENPLESLLMMQTKSMLERPIVRNESEATKILKEKYKSCINSRTNQQHRIEEIKEQMIKTGGWPVIMGKEWKSQKFDFPIDKYLLPSSIIYKMRPTAIRSADYQRAIISLRKNVEFFQPTSDETNEGSRMEECERNDGCKYMLDIAAMFGAGRNSSTMKKLMEIINFAREIEKLRNIDNTNVTQLELLLSKTTKKIQANFVMWRWLKNETIFFLSPGMLNVTSKLLENEIKNKPRWAKCIEMLRNKHGIRKLYAQTFKDENDLEISRIFRYMKFRLADILRRSDWIGSKFRKDVADRVEKMNIKVVDVESQSLMKLDEEDPNELFDQLDISLRRSYLNYISKENYFSNGALFFGGTTFNLNFPQYLKYGGIGFAVGREISNVTYNPDKENLHLWEMINDTKGRDVRQCVIEQYNDYKIPRTNKKVNGSATVDQNIVDVIGLKLAYSTYKKWLHSICGEEPKLPGLEEYNSRQMFWINAANNWCATKAESSVDINDYTPDEFRVIGPFSNLDEFAEDFKCRSGTSKMNPKNKCQIFPS